MEYWFFFFQFSMSTAFTGAGWLLINAHRWLLVLFHFTIETWRLQGVEGSGVDRSCPGQGQQMVCLPLGASVDE